MRPAESGPGMQPEELSDGIPSYRWLVTHLKADNKTASLQLCTTSIAFVAAWALSAWGFAQGLSVIVILPVQVLAAGLLVRLFMFQHDCGHGSFFESKWLNNGIGSLLSVITLTPYDQWRSTHAFHHANNGNLDQRGVGDIHFFTVNEYLDLPFSKRLGYRIYRHPLVFFVLGPIYLFVLKHRIPIRAPDGRTRVVSVTLTNLAILGLFGATSLIIGIQTTAKTQLPITWLASIFGVWIFYVQHQFEGVNYWRRPSWCFKNGTLQGSSYYILPKELNWFTADIGIHHVHHLCSKVPNYRLRECIDTYPRLRQINPLTLGKSFKAIYLTLWDEQHSRLVGFSELNSISSARLKSE